MVIIGPLHFLSDIFTRGCRAIRKIEFLSHLMEILNTNGSVYPSISEILRELCEYLDFGAGFGYTANHESIFMITDSYCVYPSAQLPESIDLMNRLGDDLIRQLSASRSVSFRKQTCDDPLKKALAEIFDMRSMLLIPILDPNASLTAFVGIADRRGSARTSDEDIAFAYAILNTLASYIKIQLYYKRLESTQSVLKSVTDNMGVDIYVNDYYTHEILYANQSMAAPYGGSDKMLGEVCWKVLYKNRTGPCDYCPKNKLIDEDGNPTKMYAWDYQRPFDGSWFRVLSAATHWVDGRLAHIVSSIDITEKKKNEQTIHQLASYDMLTGLPNRYKLAQDCDELITQQDGYLIFFDLDGFKAVNDRLGHQFGDELLIKIGKPLMENPLTCDSSYRYGGDEFIVLCHGGMVCRIREILDFLISSFKKPFDLTVRKVRCGASFGVSRCPLDGNVPAVLTHNADQAMYVSKRSGTGMIHFYNQGDICDSKAYFKGLGERTLDLIGVKEPIKQ